MTEISKIIAFFDIGKGQTRVIKRMGFYYVYIYEDSDKWVSVSKYTSRYSAIQKAMVYAGILETMLKP